jgi:hypothetical protein
LLAARIPHNIVTGKTATDRQLGDHDFPRENCGPQLSPVLLANMPALNNTSKLMCMWAGVMEVVMPGQMTYMIP